jgi:hypothetical protein
MFDNDEDYELQKEAKEVARKTMQMDDWERYVEGAAFKILKLEREVQRLRFNFYMLIFFIFGLPILLRILGVG